MAQGQSSRHKRAEGPTDHGRHGHGDFLDARDPGRHASHGDEDIGWGDDVGLEPDIFASQHGVPCLHDVFVAVLCGRVGRCGQDRGMTHEGHRCAHTPEEPGQDGCRTRGCSSAKHPASLSCLCWRMLGRSHCSCCGTERNGDGDDSTPWPFSQGAHLRTAEASSICKRKSSSLQFAASWKRSLATAAAMALSSSTTRRSAAC